jgi:hypothetical protein
MPGGGRIIARLNTNPDSEACKKVSGGAQD